MSAPFAFLQLTTDNRPPTTVPMIHVIATIEVVPGARDQFLTAFHELVPYVLAEDGCIEYGPTVDVPGSFGAQIPYRADVVTIMEKWRDVEALKAHSVAPHMTPYRAAVKSIVVGMTLQILQPA